MALIITTWAGESPEEAERVEKAMRRELHEKFSELGWEIDVNEIEFYPGMDDVEWTTEEERLRYGQFDKLILKITDVAAFVEVVKPPSGE